MLRHEEPTGAHFEGLYFEAAEVARCVAAGATETPQRTLDDTLATMATLDMVRDTLGIDFVQAGLTALGPAAGSTPHPRVEREGRQR